MADLLPSWELWDTCDPYSEFEPTLDYLELALDSGVIQACNIGRCKAGYQVSVRRDTDGWEVYYGSTIGQTIARAVMAGPQSEPPPVGLPVGGWVRAEDNVHAGPEGPLTVDQLKDWPIGGPPHDNGFEWAFNSEGIELP